MPFGEQYYDPSLEVPTYLYRRLSALAKQLRQGGHSGLVKFDPLHPDGPRVYCIPPSAAAQQVADGWDWSERADLTVNPPAATVEALQGVRLVADAAKSDADAAKAAANAVAAANAPFWAGRVVADAAGRFSASLPAALFPTGTIPVALATVMPVSATDRPHTCNLLTVTTAVVTGYVTYVRRLPNTGLMSDLKNFDPVQPSAGAVVHLRVGFPKVDG